MFNKSADEKNITVQDIVAVEKHYECVGFYKVSVSSRRAERYAWSVAAKRLNGGRVNASSARLIRQR
jgi:hypothetical protein